MTRRLLALVQRSRNGSCTEGGDAPAMQGATTENTGQYLREEQPSSAGCSAGRMPSYFAIAALACAALVVSAVPALAVPDLRQGRQAGPLTVYPDDLRRNVFYYPPGNLAVATSEAGAPDIHLLHARYTGSAAMGDRGAAIVRSIFTLRVVLDGPTPADLAAARKALAATLGGTIELRPLPIRRVESAIVYTPVTGITAGPATPAAPDGAAASERPLPAGHFETSETSSRREGFWTERVYTLGLAPNDAQLLSDSLENGRLTLSIGYAFLSDGIGPDQPLQELTGSPALVAELKKQIEPPAPKPDGQGSAAADRPAPHIVRAGALGVTADVSRWPHIVRRIDINESAPPGYAALDVYCYDFNQGGESPLYEKQIEIEAAGVGGQRVRLTTIFSRSQPDLYARSLRFPVAVRLDRPYRFRVLEISQDGTSKLSGWLDRPSWTELLDITAQGVDR